MKGISWSSDLDQQIQERVNLCDISFADQDGGVAAHDQGRTLDLVT